VAATVEVARKIGVNPNQRMLLEQKQDLAETALEASVLVNKITKILKKESIAVKSPNIKHPQTTLAPALRTRTRRSSQIKTVMIMMKKRSSREKLMR